ncbi:beta-glucosidase family protein [Sediminitomix flava]|uniref:Beta-glucosidase n=1 Tax=Sediminitomix flava TaxID=379075 RepID=A0A315ZAW6_SEDFL|nr:glycoside hydrolase family 3 C-terminal domain-containing protein [Sediminitomix flava]PWJ41864.1 beta-glucosidase [Sediminitomix flava]
MTANFISNILQQLSLEEKAKLCVGDGMWKTNGIERLRLKPLFLTDGPHGVRKSIEGELIIGSVPATCFPTASALGATWNTALMYQLGNALGEEARLHEVHILLGPGINIKRSPLGGRNFEYFSEDPYLGGVLASAYIKGVQEKGVGTSLKHFAVNNQELDRMVISAEVDERSLREIYLKGFEIAIKEAQPWTVMCAYNKLNGTYCAEHKWLLHDILKKEWEYEGIVISDWGAVNDRVESLKASLHLQMPGDGNYSIDKVVKAVKKGNIKESDLDKLIEDYLKVYAKVDFRNSHLEENQMMLTHHNLSKKIADESIVLLKNENNILPLDIQETKRITIVGDFALNPRYQGAGSSLVSPYQITNFLESLSRKIPSDTIVEFAQGYDHEGNTNAKFIGESLEKSKSSDFIFLCVGLPDSYESEAFDRKHLTLPEGHLVLIDQLSKLGKKLVIILFNGAPVEMPWIEEVDGVIEAYLTGQAGGEALSDIVLGHVNPSGKIAESFPVKVEDTPSFLNWGEDIDKVNYGEGIFVGYRYYEKKNIKPLFPFGYGLSYTEFEISNFELNTNQISEGEVLECSVNVKNVGSIKGKVVIQLYVGELCRKIISPIKELKRFQKVELEKGETLKVCFELSVDDFKYFNPKLNQWTYDEGSYSIKIGQSSADISVEKEVSLKFQRPRKRIYTKYSTVKEVMESKASNQIVKYMIKYFTTVMIGKEKKEWSLEDKKQVKMLEAMLMDWPLKNFISFSKGRFTDGMLNRLIQFLNS